MSKRERGRQRRRGRRWLRKLALVGLASSWLGVLGLALPLVAHGDTSLLASYGASASGWAIQPYVLNDAFLNIPALDQASPYLFVSIDNTPSADAKAAYFTPGTAINAVLATENTGQQVPNGVEARYPGTGAASSQVGPVSDGVATQAGAASESVQAEEAYAEAQAGLASYQFAPTPGSIPPGGGGGPLPTVPPIPTIPPIGSTPTSPPGDHSPTPTPTPPSKQPTPTATPCLAGLCLSAPVYASNDALSQAGNASPAPVKLPDLFEQQLATALRAVELANPQLLQLANGHLATSNSQLPYAAADESGEAVTQATNSGATIAVTVHAGHVELFQGLITFAAIDSTLQGQAPASNAKGQGQITTTIIGAAIGGIPVTIDQNGVQVNGQGGAQSSAVEQQLSTALNAALQQAGIKIALSQNTSMQDAGKWQGSGGGLEVTGDFEPGHGVPGTHVDFTVGEVSGSAYALPGAPFNGGGGGFGGFGGGYYGGGGFGGLPSGGTGGSNTPPQNPGSKLLSLLSSLSPGELLSLLFIVQGVSTAAVASAAGGAETAAKAGKLLVEEETR